MEKWLVPWRNRCCAKPDCVVGTEQEGQICSWGLGEVLKEDSEMPNCICVCKIPLCPIFPASGSAGKGSRPVDLGPDYKPPLGGECGAKLLHGPVWCQPGNTLAAVPELLLCGMIPVPLRKSCHTPAVVSLLQLGTPVAFP